ncbi:hypothetical protein [Hyalangium rubrum]|uniref:Glycosyl hydrolase family 67 C-terminal domain-containing protein n=1 Tax=Hyalangium rubrum TaxID=3103134 RepID=A0ABU5GZB0_9BACT|nr:hypothetical protein [Hyalangium sp. s54d21]MDY7226518.1 hypothetical protein [Hyalangium sp. s54d21]
MTWIRNRKKPLFALAVALVAIFLGLWLGGELNAFLGIRFQPKALPPLERPAPAQRLAPLEWRLTDVGSVGIAADPSRWGRGDYTHHERRYERVLMAEPPYVDAAAFAQVEKEFQAFADRMASLGFNGIIMNGFLEFVNFDRLDDGLSVYPEGSAHRQRHLELQRHFRRLFTYAESRGLRIVLKTDMVALTTPLERYLQARLGRVDAEDPRLWKVYGAALEELFKTFPEVDGLMIRIGEAGSVYNQQGWDYRSELQVRTDEAVRLMLRTLLSVAEAHDRYLFFRTWSVGVGEVGDMHTRPPTYERVLGEVDSPRLILSTKYCQGDFDSWLPLNSTLLSGRHQRIIEFQARREFESFNAYPNYMGPLYRTALLTFREHNPNIQGVWVWTQDGGPLRSGPLMLYPFHGHWLFVDANVHALARLSQDPTRESRDIAREWAREQFGDAPATLDAWEELLLASHPAVMRGLYINAFARWEVRALGLEPPPMLWIFKWDIVGGSSSVMSNIYAVSREHVDATVREGFAAAEAAGRLRELAAKAFAHATRGREWEAGTMASLDYMEDLYGTLAWYRSYLLQYYRWLEQGGDTERAGWQEALARFEVKETAHVARYRGNLDFPAYNFREAEAGLVLAKRSALTAWAARLVLLVGLAALLLGLRASRLPAPLQGLGTLWQGGLLPWKPEASGGTASPFLVGFILLVILGCAAITSSMAAPLFLLATALLLASYVTWTWVLLTSGPRPARLGSLVGALAPLYAWSLLVLAVVAVRGALLLPFLFWTHELFRLVFACATTLLVVWTCYGLVTRALASGLRGSRAFGGLLLVLGLQFLLAGGAAGLAGLERTLTALNDELLVLPGGLSRILGITTHLDIPLGLPVAMAVVGAAFALVGGALAIRAGRPWRAPSALR